MAQGEKPTRKVVKRVGKRTVVKKPPAPAETVRFGRPATKTAGRLRPAARVVAKPAVRRPIKGPKPVRAPRPRNDWGKKFAATGGKAAISATTTARSARTGFTNQYNAVRAYRLPHVAPRLASPISGFLVGVVTVAVVGLFANLFSIFRGTSTGGGRWGTLTLVVVAFIAFALGEYLLAKLQVRQSRLTSILAVSLTLMAILAFFVGVVDSAWAWLILPPLGAVSYLAAHELIRLADSSRERATNQ